MKINNKYYSEHRGNRNLIIFPDKPFWIVGDNSLETIIKYFTEEISDNELFHVLTNDYGYDNEEITDTLSYIENVLVEANLDKNKDIHGIDYTT